MRMVDLARRTGLPIATIKFYRREDLLHPGRRTGHRVVEYDDGHVGRIHMIRTLTGIGRLSITSTREVLRAVDDRHLPIRGLCEVIDEALLAADGAVEADEERLARVRVDQFVGRLGWRVDMDSPGRATLAQVLTALRRLDDVDVDVDIFLPYARAAEQLAVQEAQTMPHHLDSAQQATSVVARTVLMEVVLAAMRRMVRDHVLALREEDPTPPA